MKVILEGSRTEFEELAETIALGVEYKNHRRPNHGEVSTGDDVPNRFREEGA